MLFALEGFGDRQPDRLAISMEASTPLANFEMKVLLLHRRHDPLEDLTQAINRGWRNLAMNDVRAFNAHEAPVRGRSGTKSRKGSLDNGVRYCADRLVAGAHASRFAGRCYRGRFTAQLGSSDRDVVGRSSRRLRQFGLRSRLAGIPLGPIAGWRCRYLVLATDLVDRNIRKREILRDVGDGLGPDEIVELTPRVGTGHPGFPAADRCPS